MLQRDIHASSSQNSNNVTYTLYAANKIYNGYDGDTTGYIESSSIQVDGAISSSLNAAWNHYEPQGYLALNEGIFLGGFISGAMVNNEYIHPKILQFSDLRRLLIILVQCNYPQYLFYLLGLSLNNCLENNL